MCEESTSSVPGINLPFVAKAGQLTSDTPAALEGDPDHPQPPAGILPPLNELVAFVKIEDIFVRKTDATMFVRSLSTF